MNNHHIVKLLASERVTDIQRETQPLAQGAQRRQGAAAKPTLARIVRRCLRCSPSDRAVSPRGAETNVEPVGDLRLRIDRGSQRRNADSSVSARIPAHTVRHRRLHLPITARGVAGLSDYYGERGQR